MSEPCVKCEGDLDGTGCIDGAIYGPCEAEHCYGTCQYEGACECPCHDARNPSTEENK